MNVLDLQGLEKWRCPFFARVCRRVLGEYLESNGFSETSVDVTGVPTFSRFGVFLEVGYDLESAPSYEPTVVLGVGEKTYDESFQPCGVPFWYVIPGNLEENKYSDWTFKTEAELEKVLARIRDEVLELYAKPLWLNLDRLEKVISRFRAEFSSSSKA